MVLEDWCATRQKTTIHCRLTWRRRVRPRLCENSSEAPTSRNKVLQSRQDGRIVLGEMQYGALGGKLFLKKF